MPKLMDNMDRLKIAGPGSFNYSAIRPDMLGATEYTLVTLALDRSGSVRPFSREITEMLKTIIKACRFSPRAENIMVRLITFNDALDEVHGFKPLSLIDENAYLDLACGGETALYDAAYSSIAATLAYSKRLQDKDFAVNGITFIVTDGDDNASKTTPTTVLNQVELALEGEDIESLLTILIGVNDINCRAYLQRFKDEAKLNQYIGTGDATPGKLAKLAQFVSKSVISQSQSLRTGKASQSLTF